MKIFKFLNHPPINPLWKILLFVFLNLSPVISPVVAGNLARLTVLNTATRHRLEADSCLYHRKNLLHDIKMKHAVNNNDVVDQLVNVFK